MGTTAFMAMFKYRPDIGEKIRLAHLLSPVAYVSHMASPIGWIAGLGNILESILVEMMGVGEFLPNNLLMDCMASLFCHEGSLQGLCTNILFVLCGFDEPQMNTTLLETIIHHTPAGASTRTILHYAQEVNSDNFEGYDWGSDKKTTRSTSDGCIMRGGHLVAHWSRTQQIVALSSCEAELNGIRKVAQAGLAAKHLSEEIFDPEKLEINTDSSAGRAQAR